jgi:hypothetical protein
VNEKKQYNGLEMTNRWIIATVLRQNNITTANVWCSETGKSVKKNKKDVTHYFYTDKSSIIFTITKDLQYFLFSNISGSPVCPGLDLGSGITGLAISSPG